MTRRIIVDSNIVRVIRTNTPTPAQIGAVPVSSLGVTVATLGSDGKLVASQRPSPNDIGAVPASDLGVVVATLVDGKLTPSQRPSPSDIGAIPTSEKGSANGVATLGSDGKLVAGQIPSPATMGVIPISEKGVANGVATLDGSTKLPASQLPSLLTIQNGNLGVNQTTPEFTLDVTGHLRVQEPDNSVEIIISSPPDKIAVLSFRDGLTRRWYTEKNNSGDLITTNYDRDGSKIGEVMRLVDGTQVVRMEKVGIGTSFPVNPLTVIGNITAGTGASLSNNTNPSDIFNTVIQTAQYQNITNRDGASMYFAEGHNVGSGKILGGFIVSNRGAQSDVHRMGAGLVGILTNNTAISPIELAFYIKSFSGSMEVMKFGPDGAMDIYFPQLSAVKRLSVGAPDSGGSGYRVLRISN